MKEQLYKATQSFSRAIIQPVLNMAVVGILISIAALIKIEVMPDFLITIGNFFFDVLVGGAIAQLPVIFCVGLTAALAKKKKTEAAILGISTFMLFLYANHAWLDLTGRLAPMGEQGLAGTGQNIVLGVQVIDMGVFLGIMLGLIAAYIFNKLCDTKLPQFFAPYEGTRFAFFVMIFVTMSLAVALTYLWPPINGLVMKLVEFISSTAPAGLFVYGFANRMLLPLGLHHLLWMPIYYTPLGGIAEVGGEVFHGAMNIWYAELGNISQVTSIHPSIGYLLNFGYTALPVGAALAFIKTAKPENKAKVKAIVWPAVFAAAFAGITEPIEFLYLFTAPILWLAHSIVYGLGLLFSSLAGIGIEVGNIIGTLVGAVVVPVELGRHWMIPLLFVVFAGAQYFIFKTIIEKMDLKTLGRLPMEDEAEIVDPDESHQVHEGAAVTDNIQYIIDGLGGKDNISEINNCVTRLRIDVKDDNLVKESLLKKAETAGIIRRNKHVQIVIGRDVTQVREELEQALKLE